MTALTLEMRPAALPWRTVAVSIAVHAAALLFLPGLLRQADKPEPPPLMATFHVLPAVQADAPSQPAARAEVPPRPQRPKPEPVASAPIRPTARPILARPDSPAPAAPAPAQAEAPARPAAELPLRSATPPSAAVAAPAAAPLAAAAENVLLEEYGRALSELLAHQQQYPRLAALRGWEGEVRLRLKVARKGNLIGVQVLRSSGYEVLDQNALQMVQGTPLPPPPEALGDKEIQIVVPIHYKLQRPA